MIYIPTIGLEIHSELKTQTKMFCGCLNVSLRETEESRGKIEISPNTNICPICLGHPGTLPVINKKAVESVLKLGMALNGEIPELSKFDRKNYFYPDLPKAYQISQYDQPLVVGGELNISLREIAEQRGINAELHGKLGTKVENRIKLRRIHLEEDTARLAHNNSDSLVDFNRAGVPLMELVTEPDIKNGKEAVDFAKELQLILRYLGISDADMEKGQMRVEANISLREIAEQRGQNAERCGNKLGTKVEIKNLNSFRAVQDAIDYEIKRQKEILESGKKVIHETRGWDENKKATVSQRAKEEARDYRYFPEPDLLPMKIVDFDLDKLKAEITELPQQKRERFQKEYGLKSEQIEIFIQDRDLAEYFEESASELKSELKTGDYQTLFNYLTSDIKGLTNELGISIKSLNITPDNFADMIVLVIKGEISSRIAKDLLKEMHRSGIDPQSIIQEKGWSQIFDEEKIKKAIKEVIFENESAVNDYKNGKGNILQFLIGKTMAKLKGRGNPEKIKELLKRSLI